MQHHPCFQATLFLSIPSDFCVVSFLALCLNFRQNNKLFLIQAKIHNIPPNPWAVTIYSCWVDDCREGRTLNNFYRFFVLLLLFFFSIKAGRFHAYNIVARDYLQPLALSDRLSSS